MQKFTCWFTLYSIYLDSQYYLFYINKTVYLNGWSQKKADGAVWQIGPLLFQIYKALFVFCMNIDIPYDFTCVT